MIRENHSLKSLNTFGLDVKSSYFTSVDSKESLLEVLNSDDDKCVCVGSFQLTDELKNIGLLARKQMLEAS